MTEYQASVVLEFIENHWISFKQICSEKDENYNDICRELAKMANEEWEEEE